jgi:hypothetical protein
MQMTTFRIYDNSLNRVPSQITAQSWDEMIKWAENNGYRVGKRHTEWDREKARVMGIEGDVACYAGCVYQGGNRAYLVEFA